MLFTVNLFAISEYRDLLAFCIFTALFGVWYRVMLFMLSTSSWWISRKPIVYRRIASHFLTAFAYYINMLWVFVNRAIYRDIRPGYSVHLLSIASGFMTPFIFHIDMIWGVCESSNIRHSTRVFRTLDV